MKTFAQRIKDLIKIQKTSQAQLAKRLNISAARLNSYLSGKSECGYSLLTAIAQALDCSVDYLLGLSNNYNTKNFPESLSSRYTDISNSAMSIDIPLYMSGDCAPSGTVQCDALYKSVYTMPYAVKMNDNSMEPYCKKGDILIIAPRSYIPPVINSLNPNKLYAVSITDDDNIGTSIRHCLSKENILFLRPSVLDYDTIGIDLNCSNPVKGTVVKILTI